MVTSAFLEQSIPLLSSAMEEVRGPNDARPRPNRWRGGGEGGEGSDREASIWVRTPSLRWRYRSGSSMHSASRSSESAARRASAIMGPRPPPHPGAMEPPPQTLRHPPASSPRASYHLTRPRPSDQEDFEGLRSGTRTASSGQCNFLRWAGHISFPIGNTETHDCSNCCSQPLGSASTKPLEGWATADGGGGGGRGARP